MQCRICDREAALCGTSERSAAEVSGLHSRPTESGGVLNIEYIFEMDVHRHVVNCTAQVVAPASPRANRNDLTIIFGVSYREEILDLLRDRNYYRDNVLCLEGAAPCIAKA